MCIRDSIIRCPRFKSMTPTQHVLLSPMPPGGKKKHIGDDYTGRQKENRVFPPLAVPIKANTQQVLLTHLPTTPTHPHTHTHPHPHISISHHLHTYPHPTQKLEISSLFYYPPLYYKTPKFLLGGVATDTFIYQSRNGLLLCWSKTTTTTTVDNINIPTTSYHTQYTRPT
eukprot:TRINITY_DN3068_c0_g1_i6.p1 TRINITY_DN3068_c0_g1~~TRINITY_DN3068_c0_g1_i6.p1  ORF type:complete len:170 (+),score=4.71 TRINITY_DN3068_c0_g1_i6:179-688(+)